MIRLEFVLDLIITSQHARDFFVTRPWILVELLKQQLHDTDNMNAEAAVQFASTLLIFGEAMRRAIFTLDQMALLTEGTPSSEWTYNPDRLYTPHSQLWTCVKAKKFSTALGGLQKSMQDRVTACLRSLNLDLQQLALLSSHALQLKVTFAMFDLVTTGADWTDVLSDARKHATALVHASLDHDGNFYYHRKAKFDSGLPRGHVVWLGLLLIPLQRSPATLTAYGIHQALVLSDQLWRQMRNGMKTPPLNEKGRIIQRLGQSTVLQASGNQLIRVAERYNLHLAISRAWSDEFIGTAQQMILDKVFIKYGPELDFNSLPTPQHPDVGPDSETTYLNTARGRMFMLMFDFGILDFKA